MQSLNPILDLSTLRAKQAYRPYTLSADFAQAEC